MSARARLLVVIGLVGCGSGADAPATRIDLSQPWATGAPADVGMSGQGLDGAASHCAAIPRCRAVVVARHGLLVYERYFAGADADTPFDVRSVTKSVVGALTGIALRDGIFGSLDDSIDVYLGGVYTLDDENRAVHLAHLTTMTGGWQWDDTVDYNLWIFSDDHVKYLLDRPHAVAPGAFFDYNSAAVHVLGVALQRASGLPLPDFAAQHLFAPLAIDGVVWEELENGTVNGGAGIHLKGRDLLKLGQLYLQRGWSATTSVVPESWVGESSSPQFSWRDPDDDGVKSVTYGRLWWVSDHAPGTFFAWGYGGQLVFVVPSLDLVVVTTSDWQSVSQDPGGVAALENAMFGIVVNDVFPSVK